MEKLRERPEEETLLTDTETERLGKLTLSIFQKREEWGVSDLEDASRLAEKIIIDERRRD